MGRILAFILSLHWLAVFAMASAAAISGVAESEAGPIGGQALAAVAHAIVAALFLWTALAAVIGEEGPDLEEIATLAVAAACAVLSFGIALKASVDLPILLQFCALLVTFIAIRLDRGMSGGGSGMRQVNPARAMASGAANAALLSRITRRRDPGTP